MDTSASARPAGLQLGTALRDYRMSRRMTQRHLAMRLGVTQQTIARWEKGAPPRSDMVQAILAELEMPNDPPKALADVITLPRNGASNSPSTIDESEMSEMRAAFLRGCVQIVSRGDRLPDDLMLDIARQLRERN